MVPSHLGAVYEVETQRGDSMGTPTGEHPIATAGIALLHMRAGGGERVARLRKWSAAI